MKNRRNTQRLVLSRTTLRRLGARELSHVAGGTLPRRKSEFDCGGDIIVFDIVD